MWLPRTAVKLVVLRHPRGLDRASSRCTLSSVGDLLPEPGSRRRPQNITRAKGVYYRTYSPIYYESVRIRDRLSTITSYSICDLQHKLTLSGVPRSTLTSSRWWCAPFLSTSRASAIIHFLPVK